MRPITPPPDSGTQPAPHYCTSSLNADGTAAGCPSWPGCLFPGWFDDEPEPDDDDDDDDEVPGIAVTLAAVLGYFVGAIVLVGSATLLYLEVF